MHREICCQCGKRFLTADEELCCVCYEVMCNDCFREYDNICDDCRRRQNRMKRAHISLIQTLHALKKLREEKGIGCI